MDMTGFVGAILGLVLAILWDELAAWSPRLTRQIVLFAAKRVPPTHRQRLAEEWMRSLEDTPGAVAKFLEAFQFLVASERLVLGPNRVSKRIFECFVSSALLLFTLPLLMIVVAATTFCSRQRAFYKQPKRGRDGRRIMMHKLRTKAFNGRLAPIGSLISSSGIDRLPLLFDVLRGDLALVGPPPGPDVHGIRYHETPFATVAGYTIRPGLLDMLELCQSREEWDCLMDDYVNRWSWAFELRLFARIVWQRLSGRPSPVRNQ